MQATGSVRVDVVKGKGPGQLEATLCFVAGDGTILERSDPVVLVEGKSLTYGPFSAEYSPTATHTFDSTPAAPPAKGAAAAGPGASGAATSSAQAGKR